MIILNQHMTVRSGFSAAYSAKRRLIATWEPTIGGHIEESGMHHDKAAKSTIRKPFIVITDLLLER